MNEKIISASLDQSLLAMDDIENNELERSSARSAIASALALAATVEQGPGPQRRNVSSTADKWVEDIELLAAMEAGGFGNDGNDPETQIETPAPQIVEFIIERPRGPRGPRRGTARS